VLSANSQTSRLPARPHPGIWRRRIIPWLWVSPALVLVGAILLYPVINTLLLSFQNADSTQFVGLTNYQRVLTTQAMLIVLRNNLLWIIVGTIATVILGVIIAVLVDRVRLESLAKSAIFIPMAISFVGAGVIWRFVYQYNPPGSTQIGFLNAIITRFGAQPQAWLINPSVNNIALIIVYVWMWTGFCMVIISAALKGIPAELLEAARLDGANEFTILIQIILPQLRPTIAVVTTTMIINLLKIFDIVYVMTGGNFQTNVISFEYYQQLFTFNNFGIASALAVLLLIFVAPIMLFNIRQFRYQEGLR
jgi:alpha-glucoside transport system permease protein